MDKREKLLDFFRLEIEMEEQSGFVRLDRVPDSRVADKLKHYRTLNHSEKQMFKECAALWCYRAHAFVVDAPEIDPEKHPYYYRWLHPPSTLLDADDIRDVPILRAMVQQYKIDKHRGVKSVVTNEQFEYASSIRSLKGPELRRRVRTALQPFGPSKIDDLGNHHCQIDGEQFYVNLDFGGRNAQLRYFVSLSEFSDVQPYHRFCFEQALGFGFGHWNFVIEQNAEEVFTLFSEVVRYSFELPRESSTGSLKDPC